MAVMRQSPTRPHYPPRSSAPTRHRHDYAHDFIRDVDFCIVPGCGHETRDHSAEALPLVAGYQLPHAYRRQMRRAAR